MIFLIPIATFKIMVKSMAQFLVIEVYRLVKVVKYKGVILIPCTLKKKVNYLWELGLPPKMYQTNFQLKRDLG